MTLRSAWLADVAAPQHPVLAGDQETDLVVVGAGITGLTTALLAQRDGLRVAVVEARFVGAGTTGHTTGKVTAQHGACYRQLSERHGQDAARVYAEANRAGTELVAQLCAELDIEADLTRAPAVVYTRDPARAAELAVEVEAAQSAGLPAQLVAETDLPFAVAAAAQLDDQLHLQPVRYLHGLAAAFVAAGGRLFEHSRVQDLDHDEGRVTARTVTGAVHAGTAVVATLLPFGTVGGYFARTRPGRSFGVAVRLRTEAPRSMTISVDEPLRSTRPWPAAGPEGLIVVGGGHETGTADDTAALLAELIEWTGTTFDVAEIEHQWSGQDYATADGLPYIGPTATHANVLVATGFAKWGLSAGTAAARILVDHAAGRANPWAEVFSARRIGDAEAVASLIAENLGVGKDLVTGRLRRPPTADLAHLRPGDAQLVRLDGQVVGAHRDQSGALSLVDATCTHLGCRLHFNAAETSWDCSCHGSRFAPDGTVLTGPATSPLPPVNAPEAATP